MDESNGVGVRRPDTGFWTELRKRRLPRPIAVLACLSLVGTAAASPSTPKQPLAGAAPSAGQLFQAQASRTGAQACAATYAALGAMLTQGAAFAVQTQTASQAPNAHLVQGAVGMTYALPELKGQAAGVLVAAPTAQGCEGQLVRVAPFQQSCQSVVRLLPAGSALAQNLSGVGLYRLGGNRGEAMLIPSGSSCVAVTVTKAVQQS
jgi:hypothetical protein